MTTHSLIIGRDGQLARALATCLGDSARCIGRDQLDLAQTDIASALDALYTQQPFKTLYLAAAYTQVDKAESEPELARQVNALAVGEIGRWCVAHDVTCVHYSTDYVFDGSGKDVRTEDEHTAPLNVYGTTKREGEILLAQSGAKHFIFRTSWLYDATGKNFVNTMLRLMRERDAISVVADQFGAPTYVPHLAKASIAASASNAYGIYHLCSSGVTSWHGFAEAIFTLAKPLDSALTCGQINPIQTRDYPTPAARPANSRLDCSKALRILNVQMPTWDAGLKECIAEIYGS